MKFLMLVKRETKNLYNYLKLQECLSLRCLLPVYPTFEFSIPAVVSQNVTNKSCLVYILTNICIPGHSDPPWGP